MNTATQTPTVQALITPAITAKNAPAWGVVDAIDQAEQALAPYRAVRALTEMELVASEQDMPQLTRTDLAALLDVLTNNMARQIATARALACESAKTATTH